MGNFGRYGLLWLWGCIKAIFWSGGRFGLLWRALSCTAFLAAYFEKPYREDFKAVLSTLGFSSPEWWGYVILGLFVAAVGFALRITYLETPHVTLRLYPVCLPDGMFFYLGVKNISFKELSTCLVKIVSFKDSGDAALPFAVPVALRTEQQEAQGRRGGFNLRPGEPKALKFISCEKDPQPTSVIHVHSENRVIEVPGHRKYTVQMGLYGAGAPVVKKYRFSIMNGQLVCLRHFGDFRFAKWNVEFSRT